MLYLQICVYLYTQIPIVSEMSFKNAYIFYFLVCGPPGHHFIAQSSEKKKLKFEIFFKNKIFLC